MKEENKIGINISGYINKDFGLGVAVRSNINAIKSVGIPFVVNDINFKISEEIKDGSYKIENLSLDNPYKINLIQVNFDNMGQFYNEKEKKYFENHYNIGFWAWELDSIPDEAKKYFGLLDEIWVPSNFCAEAISKSAPIPIIKIMHSIESQEALLYNRTDFNIPENVFVFLAIFDYHSSIERKNPIGVIDAFEKAFGKNNPETILVIKTSIGTKFPKEREILNKRIASNSSILLIEEILESNKFYSLMNISNCYISLHRSEGFGLTIAEAMSLEKPVIATGYSANMEFMSINNSFPVKYDIVSTGTDYYSSTDENFWANPNILHASELMRDVFFNQSNAIAIGKKAKEFVSNYLSPISIGKTISKRLEIIQNDILPIKNSNLEKDLQLSKADNDILSTKIAMLKNLAFVKLKVKFKNLQNKLTGKNRKYFWED